MGFVGVYMRKKLTLKDIENITNQFYNGNAMQIILLLLNWQSLLAIKNMVRHISLKNGKLTFFCNKLN